MIKLLPAKPLFVQIAAPRYFTTGYVQNAVITVVNKLL